VRRSTEPAAPETWIEFVFVVVAAPHGAGVAPKSSSPVAATSRVAAEPVEIVAVTTRVPASYVQDSGAAVAVWTPKMTRMLPHRARSRV
jgi:hypothetical protein